RLLQFRAEERNLDVFHIGFTSTARRCVRRNGIASNKLANSQLRGATSRASGGASVTETVCPLRTGNNALNSLRVTLRTWGLRALLTAKSYQTKAPPGASTRVISSATIRRRSGFRIEVKTVEAITSRNASLAKGSSVASPTRRFAAGSICRARAA